MHLLSSLYRALIIERPRLALGILILLTLIAAYGMRYMKLDASADSLTLENDTSIDYFREISQRYQHGDFLVLTYSPKAEMFSDESIETLKALTSELAAVEGVAGVNSIISVPLLYSPMRSLAEQKESTRTLLTPGVEREMVRQEFLHSPIYRKMLLSPDSKTSAIQLNLKVNNKYIELARQRDALRYKRHHEGLTAEEERELEQVAAEFLAYRTQVAARDAERVQEVRDIVAKYQGKAQIFLGGVTMITSDMISYIKSDLVVFGAALLLLMIVMLGVLFRQWRFVILPMGACIASVILMLGWLSWIDWRMTVISSNFVALLLIIVFAFNIYLVVRYREVHAQHPDRPQSELVLMAMRFMAVPCVYSALTTMVAFVSLVMSGIRPVIDFGWMMTIGLVVGFSVTFIVLPAGLMLLPKGEPKDRGDKSAATTLKFSRLAEFHGSKILLVSLIALIISIWGISKLQVENRFVDYFKDTSEIYKGLTVIDQQLGGTVSLDIILDADPAILADMRDEPSADTAPVSAETDAFFGDDDPFASASSSDDGNEEDPFSGDDPFAGAAEEAFGDGHQAAESSYWFSIAGLDQIKKVQEYLETLPEVGKVQSLAVTYQLAQDINKGRLNDFELNVMRNMLSADIKHLMLDPYLNDGKQQARITLRVVETTPNLKRVELVERIRQALVNDLGFTREQVSFTGMLVLYNNMLQSLFKSQIATIGVVFAAIMLMIMVLFRSFSIALISILPNLLAATTVLGAMGLVGIPLDMMTTTIAAIVVGVGVDQAIQYFYRFRDEYAIDKDYVAAMHRSHASIGRAMYYTSVIIVIGFSILMLSQFIPSIYFGALTAFAMLMAVLGTLTLLPKLILMLKPFGK
ncbi:efflux RND transporter permease subunit [Cellvibrio japonicus]|uniref:Putative membrane protein n=1 Tax=Cellvibrio japonicus (strain Ueda107) TaxID=498211 RepID=B3PIA6_CELJU|nr:MMPL family transporter [Cellvibrio japonicus]ACE85577.1 putative membrane protein [Cellvibrio japonicus Ueda107]QEI11148.1 MMPL family transporter [Cellvibrio japonicus]QEI14722.1 MMPL family transporter [Cellvibrio japonicus]QEI18302.1 MMPL family transporter [Cellvibrio japonicus]